MMRAGGGVGPLPGVDGQGVEAVLVARLGELTSDAALPGEELDEVDLGDDADDACRPPSPPPRCRRGRCRAGARPGCRARPRPGAAATSGSTTSVSRCFPSRRNSRRSYSWIMPMQRARRRRRPASARCRAPSSPSPPPRRLSLLRAVMTSPRRVAEDVAHACRRTSRSCSAPPGSRCRASTRRSRTSRCRPARRPGAGTTTTLPCPSSFATSDRHVHRRARGAAGEDPLLARQPPRHDERLAVVDLPHVVEHREVHGAAHHVLADALHLVHVRRR